MIFKGISNILLCGLLQKTIPDWNLMFDKHFKEVTSFKDANMYDLFAVFISELLSMTKPLYKSKVVTKTDDCSYMDIQKTIDTNALADRQVIGVDYRIEWLTYHHEVFLSVLKECIKNSEVLQKRSGKALYERITSVVQRLTGEDLSSLSISPIESFVDFITSSYDVIEHSLSSSHRAKCYEVNKSVYTSLLSFSNIVIRDLGLLANKEEDSVHFCNCAWFLIQQYGVRETRACLKKYLPKGYLIKSYQEEFLSEVLPTAIPDALFTNNHYKLNLIEDIKFWNETKLTKSGKYRLSDNVNQMSRYLYLVDKKYGYKYEQKFETYGVILHFKYNASEDEIPTEVLYDENERIGWFCIGLTDETTISELDAKVDSFVQDWLVKIGM